MQGSSNFYLQFVSLRLSSHALQASMTVARTSFHEDSPSTFGQSAAFAAGTRLSGDCEPTGYSSCTPTRWNQRRRICSGRCEANTSLCGPSRHARSCFGRIDLPRSLFPDMSRARQALGVCTPVCA
jgi:hypothetical protein